MKKILYTALLAASLLTSTSCENYLDVNENPNGPDGVVEPHLYLSPMLAELALAIQQDGRYLARYTAQWFATTASTTFDRHNFVTGADYPGQIWRSTYFSMGHNLKDMMAKAEEQKKWDFVGVGYALHASNWQITTDVHGEIIYSQFLDPNLTSFEYDKQEFIYSEVKRLAELALASFQKAKAEPHPKSRLAEADIMYSGDIDKWIRFTNGILAINAHHLTNKKNLYNPDQVIAYVDKALGENNRGNQDDATIRFNGVVAGDASFFGPLRGNLIGTNELTLSVRQSRYIVDLLSGGNPVLTDPAVPKDPVFTTQHLKDPRLPVMLSPSPDGQYRGIGYGGVTEYSNTTQRPNNLYGVASDLAANNAAAPGKYLFQNGGRFPIMTYAQLQFIKAEAAYKKNDKPLALTAYRNGVTAHIDYVQTFLDGAYFSNTVGTDKATFATRRTAYLANTKLMPTAPADLTLSYIMLQKYIAQWGWGFIETWSDLRRYHYVGDEDGDDYNVVDTNPSDNVFRNYPLPTLPSVNLGKPVYRARPRYASEAQWNTPALSKIGGLDPAYHTYETWFSKPE